MIATLAFTIASLVNYGFGIMCYKILAPMQSEKIQTSNEVNNHIEQIRKSKYLPLFLILSATPFFGKFIILFGGFCRTPFIMTIAIGTISRFIYYSLFMLVI
jgi:membrane protein YqaA with SNARE-associated domain